MKKLATVFVALALFIAVTSAHAVTSVTYTNSSTATVKKEGSVPFKASATFAVSNLELVVTLSNFGTYNPKSTAEILTGVFFDFAGASGGPHLTPVSATVPMPGDSVIGHRLPSGFDGNVGEEWAYTNNLAYLIPSEGIDDNEGISSTKLKWFKKKDLFPGEKISGTSPLSGVQFGITTLDDLFGSGGGLNNKALIQNTAVFVFDLPSALDNLTSAQILGDISQVTFQYGTSIKSGIDIEGAIVAQIPEPNTLSLVALSLLGVLALTRSRTRRQ
jgi:hypothetical protein